MGYPLDYPLELDSPEHYVFESEDLEDDDIIPIGSTVRSYDFVVGKHILSDDSYFEGVIEKFEPIPTCSPDCNHYIVRTTKVVRNGREEEIVEGRNDYFSTHWNNYGVIPLEMADVREAEYEQALDISMACPKCDKILYPIGEGGDRKSEDLMHFEYYCDCDEKPKTGLSPDRELQKNWEMAFANPCTNCGDRYDEWKQEFHPITDRFNKNATQYWTMCVVCHKGFCGGYNNIECQTQDGVCNDCEPFNTYGKYRAESFRAETYTPPAAAVTAAKKGLSQRKKWGRGGLSPAEAKSQGIDSGVTRARKISSGKVSRHDVRRMSAFNRHRKNNKPSKKMPDGGPTAGTIAWNLWGGTSGVNWAKKKSATMNAEEWNQRVSLTKNCSCGRKVQPYEFEMEYDEYYKNNYVRAKYRCDCGGGKCRGRIRVGSHGNSRPCTRTAEYRGYCNECSTCDRCDISLKQDYEEMGRDEGHKHGFCHQCYDDTARYGAETFGAESIKDNYELAGYLIADGTNTKIAISKETLKNYTKEEVRQFVQSEINNSTEYIKAWYYENFKGLMVRWA